MARHRGTFDRSRPEPYELSRSRIETFVRCPACFWLGRVKGVKFPSIPAFTLNSATDTLLKKDFDRYREQQRPHPFMERNGVGHLVPFQHSDFAHWTNALTLGFSTLHEPTNLVVGGGIDDIWHDPHTDELFVVDYKSTATGRDRSVSLAGAYKAGYKRQIEIYQWILRRKGFTVSNTGYFVYVDADQHGTDGMLSTDGATATMEFIPSLHAWDGESDWVETTLAAIAVTLHASDCPAHATSGFGPKGDQPCEHGQFVKQATAAVAAGAPDRGQASLF